MFYLESSNFKIKNSNFYNNSNIIVRTSTNVCSDLFNKITNKINMHQINITSHINNNILYFGGQNEIVFISQLYVSESG